jgi:hypothetical protein
MFIRSDPWMAALHDKKGFEGALSRADALHEEAAAVYRDMGGPGVLA